MNDFFDLVGVTRYTLLTGGSIQWLTTPYIAKELQKDEYLKGTHGLREDLKSPS